MWGIAEEQLIVPYMGVGGVKYKVWFADELVYAPMVSGWGLCCYHDIVDCLQGVFHPATFCLQDDQQLMTGQPTQTALLEDIFDETNWTSEQVSLTLHWRSTACASDCLAHVRTLCLHTSVLLSWVHCTTC